VKKFPRGFLWALVIFILCAMPSSLVPGGTRSIPHVDKIVHFGLFFVMGVLSCGELRSRTRLGWWWTLALSVIICTIYGGLIEILQERYFHRGGEWLDLLADVAGAVAGAFVYILLRRGKGARG
jgi:VanZ family protein